MTRVARVVAVLLAATLTAAAAGFTVPAGAGGSRAVVIVDTGSGTYTRVISFDGVISGYEALALAGANPETYGFSGQGAAVCRLFGVGNDPGGSSCLGTPDDPSYWAYYQAPDGASGWRYSGAGAGATSVRDGDVEGWRFGAGGAPGFRSFCDVVGCAPAPQPEPPPPPVDAGAGSPVGGATAAGPGPGATPAGGGGPASTGAPADPAVDPDGAPGAATTTALPDTDDLAGTGDDSARRGSTRALGVPPQVDDRGSGSPVGVLVALVIVALLAGVGLRLRRRGRAAG